MQIVIPHVLAIEQDEEKKVLEGREKGHGEKDQTVEEQFEEDSINKEQTESSGIFPQGTYDMSVWEYSS